MSFPLFTGDCNIPANATLLYDILFVGIYKWRDNVEGEQFWYWVDEATYYSEIPSIQIYLENGYARSLWWTVMGTVIELYDKHEDITVSSLFRLRVSLVHSLIDPNVDGTRSLGLK